MSKAKLILYSLPLLAFLVLGYFFLKALNSDPSLLPSTLSELKDFSDMYPKKFPDAYPEWPVDLSTKKAQITCREIALKGVEEMFEALQHLKNWKPHRKTELNQ